MLNGLITLLAYAQEAGNAAQIAVQESGAGQSASPDKPTGGGGGISGLIMIVAMIAIFYFLMIRPQQKKQKEIKKMRDALKEGDRIITAGGIHGKIKGVKENSFSIQIANDVIIKVDKGSVYPDNTPAEDIAADKR